MKPILFVACLMLSSTAIFAQQPATSSKKKQAVVYVCPKCFTTYSKQGECPKDGNDLVKMGDYYCPKCLMDEGNQPGKCNMDGTPLVQMTTALVKAHATPK